MIGHIRSASVMWYGPALGAGEITQRAQSIKRLQAMRCKQGGMGEKEERTASY